MSSQPLSSEASDPGVSRFERRLKRERTARLEAERLLLDKSTELYTALMESKRHQQSLQLALWGSGDQLWEWHAATDAIEISFIKNHDEPMHKVRLPVIDALQNAHPDDLHLAMMEWNGHLFGKTKVFDVQFRYRIAHEWHWMRMRGQAVERDASGIATLTAGTAKNVSEQQRDRRNLELLVNAFDNTSEGMCILSTNRQIIDSNRAFNDFFGFGGMQVGGRPVDTLFSGGQLDAVNRALDVAQAEGEWQGEFDAIDPFGKSPVPMWMNITAMKEQDMISYFVLSAIDITERKKAERVLQQLANFDALTGLANRGAFEDSLDYAVEHAKRNNELLALLFVDLDRFKQINDTMGHAAGDDLLRILASRLKASVRSSDLIGRWGGDEFVVLLTSLGSPNDAYRIADKIRTAVLEPLKLTGVSVSVSASIGVALFPQDAVYKAELLERADTAMYQAKSSGRNQVGCYEAGMGTTTNQQLVLETALRKAIADGELELYYQPKVNFEDGKIESVEALMRWTSPEHGLVSTEELIPLAEESGLILDIGAWVLDTACRQLATWKGTEFEGVRIAVNVSANQLRQANLVSDISRLLCDHDVGSELLEIELTESSLLDDVNAKTELFLELRQMGLSIAIDDFGTGYSSLAYLKDLPITTLKVERTFVTQIGVDPRGEAIVRTIVMLGKNLGLTVIAEGVETLEQEKFLAELECDQGQGFFYAKPLAIDALEDKLRQVSKAKKRKRHSAWL